MKQHYIGLIGLFSREGVLTTLVHATPSVESRAEARSMAVKWLGDNGPTPYEFTVIPSTEKAFWT